MTPASWLCIDQGGQSTRAAIFDADGALLSHGQAPLETRVHGPERVEHEPDALLESVNTALEAALSGYDDRRGPIRGAALATQRSTLVCASRETAEALSPVISWQDRRGAAELEAAAASRESRIQELTGLRVSPHYGAGKLRWCLQHLEAVSAAVTRGDLVAAPLASFLMRSLGVGHGWQVDPANASRMLLMDARTLEWSPELIRIFGVQEVSLPHILPTRHDYGNLVAGERRIPLRVCTGDQSAAIFCAGVPSPGTVFINIGTGAFLQCSTAAEPVFDSSLLTSVVWQDATSRSYVLEGTVNGAAAAVEAALVTLGIQRPSAGELDAALRDIARAPLYLNGVSGLGSPDWIAEFRSGYVDEEVEGRDPDGTSVEARRGAHDRVGIALLRLAAVYESIVFLIMRNLDRMRRLVPLERIVITGGLARLDWIAQQLASLSGLPVERPDDPEATLRGLLFLLQREHPGGSSAPAGMRLFIPGDARLCTQRYRSWTRALDSAIVASPGS